MHWGHAISTDLIHWQHLPIALYPDSLGYIFSGSVVVDENNTSGFQQGDEKPLVAIFTYHDIKLEKAGKKNFQSQAIAYSTDRGRTWVKYKANPVIKNPDAKDFRDPKVLWHNLTKRWIMTLAVADHVEFYSSPDLKSWEKTSEFGRTEGSHGGVWECPDLFPVTIEGTGQEKWVLILSIGNGSPNGGSGTQYFTGSFDGKTFVNDNQPGKTLWLDYGRDNYAGVTWYNAPNNRRLFLGWMSNWQYAQQVPTKDWRSAMTIPRELTLRNTNRGLRLFQQPVKEMEALKGDTIIRLIDTVVNGDIRLASLKSPLVEVILDVDLTGTNAEAFDLELRNTKGEAFIIGVDLSKYLLYTNRTKSGNHDFSKEFAIASHFAPLGVKNKKLRLHLFFDTSSAEIFANDGETVLTEIFFPGEEFESINLISKGGNVMFSATGWQLKSIWH
jgi:fructan beta-fructosidase